MYSEPSVNRRLPSEKRMNRDDALDAFLAVVNTVRPDHPYIGTQIYPIGRADVEYGTTRRSHARCGPRGRYGEVAYYATRMTYINGLSRERHLALLTHEITHIPIGSGTGSQHGAHPPEFWREMAFHALELRDAIADGALEPVFGEIDVDRYLDEVADDPNGATVDKRYWTVEECRAKVAGLIGISK